MKYINFKTQFAILLFCILSAGTFIYQQNIDLSPNDLEFLKLKPAVQPTTLSADDVKLDIKYLIYGLENAYIGKSVYEKPYHRMLSEFQKISNNQTSEISVDDFHKLVNDTLSIMPDGHLYGSLVDVNSATSKFMCQAPARDLSGDEESRYQFFREKNKNILLMKISSFQGEAEQLVNQYVTPISDHFHSADAIILDLRGNSGGLVSIPLELASLFWGEQYRLNNMIQYYPMPIKKSISIRTPASYALEKNQAILSKSSYGNWLIENSKKSFLNKIFEFNEYDEYGNKRLFNFDEYDFPNQSEVENNDIVYDQESIDEKIYKHPVFLILDSGCQSACEKLVEALEAHPYVKTIGSRTAGAAQFGNITQLILPKSMIGISVATSYNEYKDDRQVERVGYEPQILISTDRDPIEAALSLIK